MRCPRCNNAESKVLDSRPAEEGASIRRRRECLKCEHRFTTYERLGESPIIVIKADGSSEVYERQKLLRGLLIAWIAVALLIPVTTLVSPAGVPAMLKALDETTVSNVLYNVNPLLLVIRYALK